MAYDWFYSVNGGTTWFYYTTTTVNTVLITTGISANNPLPSVQPCPDLSTTWKGTANTVPTVNTARGQRVGQRQRLRRVPRVAGR